MAKLVGQDAKTGKFTQEALQQDIRDVTSGEKKIIMAKPKKREDKHKI